MIAAVTSPFAGGEISHAAQLLLRPLRDLGPWCNR